MLNFLKNVASVSNAIDICLEKGLIVPALILLYSCIDVIGSLERAKGEGTKDSFVRWVENYLLKAKPFECTAIDLFAARCGVLHTLTAQSDLLNQGKARLVVYAWGKAQLSDLKETVKRLQKDAVSVHINDLNEALVESVEKYFEDLKSDELRRKIVEDNVSKSFGTIPASIMTEYLQNTSESSSNEPL